MPKKPASVKATQSTGLLNVPSTLTGTELARFQEALASFASELTIVEAARLSTVLEIIYQQGKKDALKNLRAAMAILEQ